MTGTAETFDLILKNGTAVTPAGILKADIGVRGGKIAGIGVFDHGAHIINCSHLHILPGVIDTQVHFREPGLTHKEDLATGSLGAVMGGVTTVFEMPNTEPLTITADALRDKLARAENRMYCDHAFFIGGCAENAHEIAELELMRGCCGTKIFMGSSTGSLLADDDATILKILQHGRRRVALHAEDNARLNERKSLAKNVIDHPHWRDAETALCASKRAVKLAREAGRPIHLLHVTTAEEMAFLSSHKDIATIETTPQHLTLTAPECYERLGTKAQMNPPIRDTAHRQGLWHAVNNGTVDVLGSDHAPHTLEEKSKPYPQSPSGMTGVQTMLPVMLDHVHAGKLSLMRLVDLLCHGPQRIYNIAGKGRIAVGYDADFAIVDLNKKMTITDKWIMSKCGWTPFDGMTVTGWVEGTILRGTPIMWGGDIFESSRKRGLGKPVGFADVFKNSNPLTASSLTGVRVECC